MYKVRQVENQPTIILYNVFQVENQPTVTVYEVSQIEIQLPDWYTNVVWVDAEMRMQAVRGFLKPLSIGALQWYRLE